VRRACRNMLGVMLLSFGADRLMPAQGPELSPEAQAFIEDHFTQARSAEALRQFDAAIEQYELILKRYPDAVPEIYQNLGLVYYLGHRYDEAIRVFERGIRLKPAMVGARLFLGSSYLIEERPRDALPHLQYAHKRQPTAESAQYLGMCLNALRRYDDANEYYRFALARSADKPLFLHLLGDSYLRLSEEVGNALTVRYPDSAYEFLMTAKVMEAQQWYQVAAQEYLEAARRDPMNAELFLLLARSLAILGDNPASEQALARYRELMPADTKVEFGDLPHKEVADVGIVVNYQAELAALAGVTGQARPALPMLPREVNAEIQHHLASPSAGAWGRVLEQLLHAQWQKASDTLAAMHPAPNDWLRDYLLATVWLWRDDADRAEIVARRLKAVAEKNPAAQMLLWDIYRQDSYVFFQKVLDEYPQSAWAHFLKGRTLAGQGKLQAAEEYQAALTADPSLPEVHIALADIYMANSKAEEALAECQKELELSPNSSAAKSRIGRIYVQERDAGKAIPYLQQALAQDPDDANARADLAQALEMGGDTERAIVEYRRALKLDPAVNRIHYILARLYNKTGKPDLAERERQLFQTNEASARQQGLDRLRQLRENGTPTRKAQ
jgi:tetratricopeptide (TPR) repeat protein